MTDRCCTDCQRTKHFTVFYARVHTRYSRCETKSATFIKAQTLNTISGHALRNMLWYMVSSTLSYKRDPCTSTKVILHACRPQRNFPFLPQLLKKKCTCCVPLNIKIWW